MLATASASSGVVARHLVRRRARLETVSAEIAMQRHVERVEPDDRARAAMLVRVPGPARRDDEVALVHQAFLAVDDGVGAVAFEHEAQRARRMAMRPRDLAGLQDLQRRGQGRRRAHAGIAQVRIIEGEDAALDRRHVLKRQRVVDQRLHRRPLPDIGAVALHLGRMRVELLPERRDMGLVPGLADMVGGGRGSGRAHGLSLGCLTAAAFRPKDRRLGSRGANGMY